MDWPLSATGGDPAQRGMEGDPRLQAATVDPLKRDFRVILVCAAGPAAEVETPDEEMRFLFDLARVEVVHVDAAAAAAPDRKPPHELSSFARADVCVLFPSALDAIGPEVERDAQLSDPHRRIKEVVLAAPSADGMAVAAVLETHGLRCCTAPSDRAAEDAAEHALALMLGLARALPAQLRAGAGGPGGEGAPSALRALPRGLAGSRLGLLGLDRAGTALAARARALDLDVCFFDQFAPPGTDKATGIRRTHDLRELLERSDFISLHGGARLEPEAVAFVLGERHLAHMQPSALLLNVSRGSMIDYRALRAALDSGRLGGAGLDAWPHLPPRPGEEAAVYSHPAVIATPRRAGLGDLMAARKAAAKEVRRILTGYEPAHAVSMVEVADKLPPT